MIINNQLIDEFKSNFNIGNLNSSEKELVKSNVMNLLYKIIDDYDFIDNSKKEKDSLISLIWLILNMFDVNPTN